MIDDADDCYRVERAGPGTYVVRHYPNRETKKACCKVSVTISDKDRARAYEFEDVEWKGSVAALHRFLPGHREEARAPVTSGGYSPQSRVRFRPVR